MKYNITELTNLSARELSNSLFKLVGLEKTNLVSNIFLLVLNFKKSKCALTYLTLLKRYDYVPLDAVSEWSFSVP